MQKLPIQDEKAARQQLADLGGYHFGKGGLVYLIQKGAQRGITSA
jgi:hypothetical protein